MISFTRSRIISVGIGMITGILCFVTAISPTTRAHFFSAYLFAYLFWLGVTLGSLALVMLHNLTGGEWGTAVRRIAEPASRMVPLMLILFVPILMGLHELFPWAQPDEVAKNELLQHRRPYLNVPFFAVRVAIYFLAWLFLSILLPRLAKALVAAPNDRSRSRLRAFSAAGLIIYLMTMTHAGYDWAMSRDTDFYSTTFGFIVTTGQTLSAVAFSILIIAFVSKGTDSPLMVTLQRKPVQNPPEAGAPNVLNDVGNILLTLIILWAYVSFMQLLVIWMGNSGEDNVYYTERGLGVGGGEMLGNQMAGVIWRWVGLALVVLHFFVPFILLLFRSTKKYLPALTFVAAIVFVAHLLEQYWLIVPKAHGISPPLSGIWIDCLTSLAIGGIWMAAFLSLLPASLAARAIDAKVLSADGESEPKERPRHA